MEGSFPLTGTEARRRVKQEPDFVYLKRFNYSLLELLERYPEGAPDRLIAQGLLLSVEEVQTIYENILAKLRNQIGVTIF
jgi:hypothetical protein